MAGADPAQAGSTGRCPHADRRLPVRWQRARAGEATIELRRRDNPEYVRHRCTPTRPGTPVKGAYYLLADGVSIGGAALARFEGEAVLVDTPGGMPTGICTTSNWSRPAGFRRRGPAIGQARVRRCAGPGRRRWLPPRVRPEHDRGRPVGVESPATKHHEVNATLCRAGVLIPAGLVNLVALGPVRLWLEAFPLKVRGVEGTPCRVVKECTTAGEHPSN